MTGNIPQPVPVQPFMMGNDPNDPNNPAGPVGPDGAGGPGLIPNAPNGMLRFKDGPMIGQQIPVGAPMPPGYYADPFNPGMLTFIAPVWNQLPGPGPVDMGDGTMVDNGQTLYRYNAAMGTYPVPMAERNQTFQNNPLRYVNTPGGGLSVQGLGDNKLLLTWEELSSLRGSMVSYWNTQRALRQGLQPDPTQFANSQTHSNLAYKGFAQWASASKTAVNGGAPAANFPAADFHDRLTNRQNPNYISPEKFNQYWLAVVNGQEDEFKNDKNFQDLKPLLNQFYEFVIGPAGAQRTRDIATSQMPIPQEALDEYAFLNSFSGPEALTRARFGQSKLNGGDPNFALNLQIEDLKRLIQTQPLDMDTISKKLNYLESQFPNNDKVIGYVRAINDDLRDKERAQGRVNDKYDDLLKKYPNEDLVMKWVKTYHERIQEALTKSPIPEKDLEHIKWLKATILDFAKGKNIDGLGTYLRDAEDLLTSQPNCDKRILEDLDKIGKEQPAQTPFQQELQKLQLLLAQQPPDMQAIQAQMDLIALQQDRDLAAANGGDFPKNWNTFLEQIDKAGLTFKKVTVKCEGFPERTEYVLTTKDGKPLPPQYAHLQSEFQALCQSSSQFSQLATDRQALRDRIAFERQAVGQLLVANSPNPNTFLQYDALYRRFTSQTERSEATRLGPINLATVKVDDAFTFSPQTLAQCRFDSTITQEGLRTDPTSQRRIYTRPGFGAGTRLSYDDSTQDLIAYQQGTQTLMAQRGFDITKLSDQDRLSLHRYLDDPQIRQDLIKLAEKAEVTPKLAEAFRLCPPLKQFADAIVRPIPKDKDDLNAKIIAYAQANGISDPGFNAYLNRPQKLETILEAIKTGKITPELRKIFEEQPILKEFYERHAGAADFLKSDMDFATVKRLVLHGDSTVGNGEDTLAVQVLKLDQLLAKADKGENNAPQIEQTLAKIQRLQELKRDLVFNKAAGLDGQKKLMTMSTQWKTLSIEMKSVWGLSASLADPNETIPNNRFTITVGNSQLFSKALQEKGPEALQDLRTRFEALMKQYGDLNVNLPALQTQVDLIKTQNQTILRPVRQRFSQTVTNMAPFFSVDPTTVPDPFSDLQNPNINRNQFILNAPSFPGITTATNNLDGMDLQFAETPPNLTIERDGQRYYNHPQQIQMWVGALPRHPVIWGSDVIQERFVTNPTTQQRQYRRQSLSVSTELNYQNSSLPDLVLHQRDLQKRLEEAGLDITAIPPQDRAKFAQWLSDPEIKRAILTYVHSSTREIPANLQAAFNDCPGFKQFVDTITKPIPKDLDTLKQQMADRAQYDVNPDEAAQLRAFLDNPALVKDFHDALKGKPQTQALTDAFRDKPAVAVYFRTLNRPSSALVVNSLDCDAIRRLVLYADKTASQQTTAPGEDTSLAAEVLRLDQLLAKADNGDLNTEAINASLARIKAQQQAHINLTFGKHTGFPNDAANRVHQDELLSLTRQWHELSQELSQWGVTVSGPANNQVLQITNQSNYTNQLATKGPEALKDLQSRLNSVKATLTSYNVDTTALNNDLALIRQQNKTLTQQNQSTVERINYTIAYDDLYNGAAIEGLDAIETLDTNYNFAGDTTQASRGLPITKDKTLDVTLPSNGDQITRNTSGELVYYRDWSKPSGVNGQTPDVIQNQRTTLMLGQAFGQSQITRLELNTLINLMQDGSLCEKVNALLSQQGHLPTDQLADMIAQAICGPNPKADYLPLARLIVANPSFYKNITQHDRGDTDRKELVTLANNLKTLMSERSQFSNGFYLSALEAEIRNNNVLVTGTLFSGIKSTPLPISAETPKVTQGPTSDSTTVVVQPSSSLQPSSASLTLQTSSNMTPPYQAVPTKSDYAYNATPYTNPNSGYTTGYGASASYQNSNYGANTYNDKGTITLNFGGSGSSYGGGYASGGYSSSSSLFENSSYKFYDTSYTGYVSYSMSSGLGGNELGWISGTSNASVFNASFFDPYASELGGGSSSTSGFSLKFA